MSVNWQSPNYKPPALFSDLIGASHAEGRRLFEHGASRLVCTNSYEREGWDEAEQWAKYSALVDECNANWTYCNGGTGVVIIAPADIAAINALFAEADSKPGLGVQDSAGLWDNELDYEYAIEDDYEWIRMGGAGGQW